MYVTVAEHDPVEISECGRYLRSRHEPDYVVDLVNCGKWIRLAATPIDAARMRRRLVRIEDIGEILRANHAVDGAGSEDVDQPQDRPIPGRRTSLNALILFVASAAGAAAAVCSLVRLCGHDDVVLRAVDGVRVMARVLMANMSWPSSDTAHWTCDL